MSSILLANPFVAPQNQAPAVSDPQPPLAPVSATQAGADATLDNTGAQGRQDQGGQNAQRSRPPTRPADASRSSVVDAQIIAPEGEAPLIGPSLPKVPMPDPLPTSPFLKPA